MAIETNKVLSIEVREWAKMVELEKARRAEIIRLKNDYLDSAWGRQAKNRVTMQQEEIARLEAVLTAKKAQLSAMRRKAKNADVELARSAERLNQLQENLAARLRLDKMLTFKALFKQMQKAGFTPPELGATVTEEEIVS